ncbi:MAG: triose-phosphate isomerase [Nitrososphaerales archaeon]
MLHFIINTKNYLETGGTNASALADVVQAVSDQARTSPSPVIIYLSVSAFSIGSLSTKYPRLNIFAQHLDDVSIGSTTGFLVPEIAQSFGVKGSLLNHSEHQMTHSNIINLVKRLKILGMTSVVCAQSEDEVSRFALLSPDYVAIEPPDLIGSGNAVSKLRPELISESKKFVQAANLETGSQTKLLCGAGIVDSNDARIAVELGAEGILVASGVIKSENWRKKVESLVQGMQSAATD